MTYGQNYGQPDQYPQPGGGQQWPQEQWAPQYQQPSARPQGPQGGPWRPQPYHPGQHQQRIQGPPPGYGQVQQYAPTAAPYQGYLPYAQPQYSAPVAPKSTGTGLVLGLLLPGVGCMYAGRAGIGVLIMGIWLLSIPLVFVFGIGFLTGFGMWVTSAILGYTMTREWNAAHGIVSLWITP